VNGSPQTPLRRPQNGTQAHDLSRQLGVRQASSGRRYPVLGPPSSPLRGQRTNDDTVNH